MCKKMILLISLVLVMALTGNASVDPDLLAHWTFDNAGDPGHDDSGNGRDLAVHGAAAYTAGGKINGAMSLPGQNTAYLEDGDGENYINGLDAVTVAVWIKSGETNSDRGFFTTRDPGGPDGKQCLGVRYDASGYIDERVIRFYVMTTEDKGLYESPGEIQTTEWQHVAITWSAAAGKSELYLDGGLQDLSRRETQSGAGEPLGGTLDNATMVRIGTGFKNLGWLGLVDEVRIYERALSGTEVLRLFNADLARDPSPQHLAEHVCPDVTLGWTPGESAISHDVYFGTSLSDVNESAAAVKEAHDTNSYPVSVELGRTYYWRIDEVNGPDTWTGKTWRFTTNDGNAFDPDPADEQGGVTIDPTLLWTPGCSATSHDVYFGTSWAQVNTMADPCATKGAGDESYNPGTLDYLTWYYWRIDEVNGANTWRGQVWSFKTKSSIIDPNMLLWFEFDETPGNPDHVRDSSGYNYHGDGDDFDEDTWDANDGRCYAGSLNMDSDQRVDITPRVLDKINHEISISVWLKGASRPGNDNWLFGSGSDDYHLAVAMPDEAVDAVIWQAGNDSNDSLIWEDATPEAWLPAWHHFVFIKNENTATMSIWLDGTLADSIGDVNTGTLAYVKSAAPDLRIGANWENNDDFIGRVDDFRIFDYELSDVEIRSLFRCGHIEKAWSPDPHDGELDVPCDVVLTWRPGNYAAYHDVYLGTDFDDVNDATTATASIYKVRQDPCEYDPASYFELNTTYYWRIDEVNDPCVWKGNVWRFTTATFLDIDDFETYNDSDNLIEDTWEDSFVNWTGSYIDLAGAPIYPVNTLSQSMEYAYNNTSKWDFVSYWSLAELPFDSPQDWTEVDMKTLTLYLYGHPDNDINDTEQLYVAVDDDPGGHAEIPYPDMNDLLLEEWTEWNIPISDFTNPDDIDETQVTRLGLIFGSSSNTTTAGGDGIAYFDDIRLYASRCVPSIIKPYADLNNNCIVDWPDVRIMGEEWLRTDANLNPVTNPGTANLVGHWKLDGDANDSSVYANHGAIMGSYEWVAGPNNQAAKFTDGRVLVPDALQLRPAAQVSAACWLYYSGNPGDAARVVVKGRNDMEAYCIEVDDEDSFKFYVGDTNGTRYSADSNENDISPDEWLHLAGTYDGTTAKSWVNGQVVGSVSVESIPLSQDTNDLAIANKSDANDKPLNATVDDVRVYNRALTAAEVGYLATDGTGYVPLSSVANLHDAEPAGSKAINFKDYTVLLESWLEEKLWPQ